MKRTSVSLVLPLIVLALLAPVAWCGDSLNFFNNWFVTGDYAVAGVGLRGTGVNGWATGTVHMTGLPSGAQAIAAFLYWSTVEPSSTPGASIGYFNGNKIQGAVLGNPLTPNPACTGGAFAFVYRADVLRYLPVDSNNIAQANGSQTVKLTDAGANGSGINTNGASLIVIYKIVLPGLPTIVPLRAVVIYNGAFTMNKQSAGLTQNVAGFYQASASAAARMTGIVANGQPGFASPLSVNGRTLDTDPFEGAQGVRWDNPSYNINLAANASSFSTLATVGNNQTCLTWAAIVAGTNVQDSDNDGLLDLWETKGLHRNTQVSPATFGTCADYPAEACVNLPAMGANPNKKDVFIQFDWMHGSGDGTGGTDGAGTHDHMPQLAALNNVASVFLTHGISLHLDVGSSNNYQGAQALCGNAPCPFIIPAAYAQGGSDIDESTLVCHDTPTHPCDYHEPYPVLSFEFGFASVRDGNHLLNISPHFAQNRRDVFHYSLFAHALAGPFDVNGHPVDPITGLPATAPLSYSGIAHRPGGGFMVTLGLWRSDIPANDQVGNAQIQEGTMMHELGHNLGLGHAGLSTKPNCMPNYASVMNYLYQTRGLTDASGIEQIDFSSGLLLPLAENFLSTSIPMGLFPGLQKYRVRYYGPLAPNQPASQAAQLHCDGTPIKGGEPFEVRLEGPAISTPDWSNGTVPLGHFSPPLDVNYDGTIGQVFLDSPDWLTLNLQQIGTGYSFGGLSVGAFATDGGAYATDAGAFATDAGALATDGGAFATDGGAFATDGGAFATDGGAFATDGGAFATDGGAFATDAGELNQATVLLSSVDPPPPPTATPTVNSILLTWSPPGNGKIASYNIYRCAGVGCTPSKPAFKNVTGGTFTPGFNDAVNDFVHAGTTCPATLTCYNTTYVYVVTSQVLINSSLAESLFSKPVSGEVTHLFVIANGQTVQYGATALPFPAPTYTVYGDVSGSLTSGVTCSYSPSTPRNAGTYTITCIGPNTTSPTDGITYNAPYLSYTPGVLTITPVSIAVTAAASNKVYDGTVSSPATPTLTTGALAYADTVNWTETYDNRNVGAIHVMTPSGVVNDQNGGNNYVVTFRTTGGGIITTRPITVTASASSKVYDGGIVSTAVPTITTGSLGSGDTAPWTEAYDNRNVGSTHVMTPAGTVSDGNGGNNYAVTFVTISTGIITPRPITVTAAASSKPYDGGIASTAVPTITSGTLVAPDTAAWTETYDNRNAGTAHVMTPAGTVTDGNGGNNYNVTFATISTGIIIPQSITVTAAASSKPYDGGIASTAVPTITLGTLIAPDTAAWTETYDNRNAGTAHVMTPTGTVTDGNGGNNYNVTFATIGTGIIIARPITVTAAASTKVYDGGTTSTAVPTITAGTLAAPDTAAWTETYDNKNVGSTHTLTPAGTVSDGNSGNNYNVTFVAIGSGVISPAPASVTPNPNGDTYGSPDPSPLTTGTLTGFVAADNVTATYTRALGSDAGTYTISATLSPAPALGNYQITYNTALFTISPAPQSITFLPLSNQPLGTPDFTVTASATSGLPVSFTAVGSCTVTAGLVHLVTTGNCTITASQAGGLDYQAAISVSQSFTITSIDFTTLSLVGSPAGVVPTATATTLTMSTAVNQTSAAWLPAKQTVGNGFTTQFTFQISSTGDPVADGFAFVIQNSAAGTGALGATGMGGFLGYEGLTNSIAIEFDTYQNDWDTNNNHVAVQSNGTGPNTANHNTSAIHQVNNSLATTLADGNVHTVKITYDGATLLVFLDGTQVLSEAVSLSGIGVVDAGGNAVVGFTAATGSDSELTQILFWTLTSN
jgi:hypothetical protein